jgi:hypothetical protein
LVWCPTSRSRLLGGIVTEEANDGAGMVPTGIRLQLITSFTDRRTLSARFRPTSESPSPLPPIVPVYAPIHRRPHPRRQPGYACRHFGPLPLPLANLEPAAACGDPACRRRRNDYHRRKGRHRSGVSADVLGQRAKVARSTRTSGRNCASAILSVRNKIGIGHPIRIATDNT